MPVDGFQNVILVEDSSSFHPLDVESNFLSDSAIFWLTFLQCQPWHQGLWKVQTSKSEEF
jgi:hypothetical protein